MMEIVINQIKNDQKDLKLVHQNHKSHYVGSTNLAQTVS